jgi:biopolymer transport protein ExbD
MSFKYACPYCNKELVVTPIIAGKEHTCPRCRSSIKLPATAPAATRSTADDGNSKYVPLSLHSHKKEEENLIDMTAMVDIVFFLLIFFMVTSIQAVQSVMELPPAQTSGASSSTEVAPDYSMDPSYLTVTIEADDTLWVDDEQVFGAQALRTKLRSLRKEDEQLNGMMVIGDPEASHGTLVMVLDAGAEAGFEDLRFSLGGELDPFAG